jgi:hypothetical protein
LYTPEIIISLINLIPILFCHLRVRFSLVLHMLSCFVFSGLSLVGNSLFSMKLRLCKCDTMTSVYIVESIQLV